ncbi:MAG: hypothetical protein Kow0090_13230 [Myxococcota bacterium]
MLCQLSYWPMAKDILLYLIKKSSVKIFGLWKCLIFARTRKFPFGFQGRNFFLWLEIPYSSVASFECGG